MNRNDFLLEEYKALQIGMRQHQTAYFTLENYTFGGMLVVYGVLFGLTSQNVNAAIPLVAWWGIFVLVAIACIRCWAHYIMVRKLARYMILIEKAFYSGRSSPVGFERSHLKSTLNPFIHLTVNAFCWMVLLGVSFGIALYKTFGWPLP